MGISMTPRDYFYGFVVGNWEDFQANQDSVRHAFNAVVAASHMADHYYLYCCRQKLPWVTQYHTFKDYLKHVDNCTDGAFIVIRDIANAYKNLYTYVECSIASTGAIESIQISRTRIREVYQCYADGYSSGGVVRYATRTGQTQDLIPVLKKVIEYWDTHVQIEA